MCSADLTPLGVENPHISSRALRERHALYQTRNLPPETQSEDETEIIHRISRRPTEVGGLAELPYPCNANVGRELMADFVAKAQN